MDGTTLTLLRGICLACALVISTLTGAQTPQAPQMTQATSAQTATNGCGSGWNRYLVPDNLRVLGCNFKPACDAHDVCYGACAGYKADDSMPPQCQYLRCQAGGDLVGKPECHSVRFRDNRLAAEERRVKCDAAFMVDLVTTNPGNARCEVFSGLYPFAVRVLGRSNFLGMDTTPQTVMSRADQERYAAAINKLLATWSDERLQEFSKQLRDGTAGVDLNKPIEFDSDRGLRNRPPSSAR